MRIRLFDGLALLAWALTACGGGQPAGRGDGRERRAEPIPVAVSVPPAAWLVEQVGGERVAVTTLLPAGRSPHTWEPSPRALAALGRAQLVVVVGHPALPFEERMLATARRAGEPRVVTMTEGVELLVSADGRGEHGPSEADRGEGDARGTGDVHGGPDGGHGRSDTDPHVWLDPEVMKATAGRVAAALAASDPVHAAEYSAREHGLLTEIGALDRDIRAMFAGVTERRFLAYHPAWSYFAARYALVQETVESGGKEPSPRRLVERVESARARGTRVIFVERASAGRGARVLAEEIGAEVVVLDSLAYDWGHNLLDVARAMAEALGAEETAAGDQP